MLRVRASSPEQASRTLDLRDRDFLLISIDALRADHLGSYGYARPTTPHLDALSNDAVVFEHAYAPSPHTSYSVTSLMTGKYMRPLLLQGIAQDSDTWAGLLRTYGYRTAAFYPPAVFFIDPDRFQTFRDSFLGFEYRWVEFAEARGASSRFGVTWRAPPRTSGYSPGCTCFHPTSRTKIIENSRSASAIWIVTTRRCALRTRRSASSWRCFARGARTRS